MSSTPLALVNQPTLRIVNNQLLFTFIRLHYAWTPMRHESITPRLATSIIIGHNMNTILTPLFEKLIFIARNSIRE
ncbi:hypothetical protein BDQ94DRAFT_138985, partial [Aspergillus welwitschiae]